MWRLKLAVGMLVAAVLVGLGIIAKEGTKADDKENWKSFPEHN